MKSTVKIGGISNETRNIRNLKKLKYRYIKL